MIFLANRANLDRRTLLTRIHSHLQTQVPKANTPVTQVWYHTSTGHKTGVRATISPAAFLGTSYPVEEAQLQISFDFPPNYEYDFYQIQWLESDRDLMLGWHQDETHMDLGECHFQLDYCDETVQRERAAFLDEHPLNVFDERTDHLVELLASLSWENERPRIPDRAVR